MKRNFNVIEINGFKGIAVALFMLCCLATGFIVFPGWLCMHVWNFVSAYFLDMPVMSLLHGSILWAILALSFYAINNKKFLISFKSVGPRPRDYNEERIKQIIKQIQERNSQVLQSSQKDDIIDEHKESNEETIEQ